MVRLTVLVTVLLWTLTIVCYRRVSDNFSVYNKLNIMGVLYVG